MARASDGTKSASILGLVEQAFWEIWVLFLTPKEQDTVPVRWRRENQRNVRASCEVAHFSCRAHPDSKIASRRCPRQWPRMMQKFTNIDQMVSSLAARVTTLETNVASASSASGSASSWNLLGHSDCSTATGVSRVPRGPGSSDDI